MSFAIAKGIVSAPVSSENPAMTYTDATSESKALKTNVDIPSTAKTLVNEAYDPSAKLFGASDSANRRQATLPNGQIDFGSFTNLYGTECATNAVKAGECQNLFHGYEPDANPQTLQYMDDFIRHIREMVQGISDTSGDPRAKPNPDWRQLREQLEQQLRNQNNGGGTLPGQETGGSGGNGSQKSDGSKSGGPADNAGGKGGKGNLGDAVGAKTGGQSQPLDTNVTADINASGVDQSSVGDCFFESALASLANSSKGQQIIRNMIKTNKDGSYTVTFAGDKGSPVTVTAKDLEVNQNNGQVEDSAKWARIVETAFLKYDHAEQYGSGLNGFLQADGIPRFGNVAYADKALQLLTGQDASTDSMGLLNIDNREITLGNTSRANIASDMETALKNGEPITACASSLPSWLGEHNSGPMEGDHVYSVMSYDAKTGTVVVRNPWGSNNGTALQNVGQTKDGITSMPDGELKMSLDTFTKYFTSMNFAGQNPYEHDAENIGRDAWTTLTDEGKGLKDLFTGNFGALPGDVMNFAKDDLQSFSDAVYGVTDAGERAVKSVVSKAWDGATGLVKGAAKVGGDIVHDLNPFNW